VKLRSRLRLKLGVLAGAVAAALAMAPAGVAAAATGSSPPQGVVVYGFGTVDTGWSHPRTAPEEEYFGADGTHQIHHLAWSGWGGSETTGTGQYSIDNCVPDCVNGHVSTWKVTAVLSRVLARNGQRYYTTLTLAWNGQKTVLFWVTPAAVAAWTGCYPFTSSLSAHPGSCYTAGEFCPRADRGDTGVGANGTVIKCEDNDGWRWEPV
jgi:hypothetical protein